MILLELFTTLNAKRRSAGKKKMKLEDFFTCIFTMHDAGKIELYEDGGQWNVEPITD